MRRAHGAEKDLRRTSLGPRNSAHSDEFSHVDRMSCELKTMSILSMNLKEVGDANSMSKTNMRRKLTWIRVRDGLLQTVQ